PWLKGGRGCAPCAPLLYREKLSPERLPMFFRNTGSPRVKNRRSQRETRKTAKLSHLSPPSTSRPPRRPAVEVLEDRTLLSTLYAWNNGNHLLRFDSATPGTLDQNVLVSGLGSGQTLLGMDFRPSTGTLYAIAENLAGTVGQLYTVNT